MSDETIESAAPPEVQVEAAKIGWKGPDQFRGDPEKFVDADEYLRRAETVLPFVRDQNRRLSTDVADLRARLESAVGENAAIKKRMEDIDIEHSTRLAKEVKQARIEAQAELEAALEAGDHKATARLTGEVARLEQIEDTPAPKKEVAAETKPQISTEDQQALDQWNAWAASNDFSNWTRREQREFLLIGDDLRREGNLNRGKLFAEDIMREMKREAKVESKESKVEGGKGSGSPRGSAKSGYAALTSEERAVCDADERKFVGQGKKFADSAAYRAHWAKVYQEQA